MSRIITFYSYKGGVGRSMALVNVATLLSMWGKKVLMIDWDLEAPGLENFFKDDLKNVDWNKQKGVLEWLDAQQHKKKVKWKDWVIQFRTGISKTDIHLLISGKANGSYSDMLRDFNVAMFYEKHDGGRRLEVFREEMLAAYDYVLIDSRTGVTDFGGICTIQLPDILVMLFSPTEQGLTGTAKIAKRVMAAHGQLPVDRFKLLICPILARFDDKQEFEKGREWLDKAADYLAFLYEDWLPSDIKVGDFLRRIKIPYIPYFSFGERLPVIEQGMDDTAGLGYAYENLSMLVGGSLDNVETFWENRSTYLEEISGETAKNTSSANNKVNIYISCVQEDREICKILEKRLINAGKEYGVNVIFRNDEAYIGYDIYKVLSEQIEDSDIIILWHSERYAKKMFKNSNYNIYSIENDIEINVIEKYSKKIIVPIYLIRPIIQGVFGSPVTPEFIRNRFGISLENSQSWSTNKIIDAVEEKILPIVDDVFSKNVNLSKTA